jgi:hypothetical protein
LAIIYISGERMSDKGKSKKQMNKYTSCIINGYEYDIEYLSDDSVLTTASFDIINKKIYINSEYVVSEKFYLECIRHEIFETILAINNCRYIPLDYQPARELFIFDHSKLDIILSQYNYALETLK